MNMEIGEFSIKAIKYNPPIVGKLNHTPEAIKNATEKVPLRPVPQCKPIE